MSSVVVRSLTLMSPLLFVACAQFTTSDAELANLKSVADTRANTYIDCLKTEASTVTSSTDYAFVTQAVSARCESSLSSYKAAQKDYLASQYILTGKPLDQSVSELEERGRDEVAELLVTRDANAEPVPAAVPLETTAGLSLSGTSVAQASAAAVASATAWSPKQRVYLDCMDEQVDKYERLNESAEAIASVAANNCRSYLTVERRQALENEGKVQVMSKIMDQRVSGMR